MLLSFCHVYRSKKCFVYQIKHNIKSKNPNIGCIQLNMLFKKKKKKKKKKNGNFSNSGPAIIFFPNLGAPVAQLVKRLPTDLADQVRSLLEVKSSQPQTEFHCTQPFIIIQTSS